MLCLICDYELQRDWQYCPECGCEVEVPKRAQHKSPQPELDFAPNRNFGSGVRAQVFEVIVRQAMAGAPWQQICAGPMAVNNISAAEVEAEVSRRLALMGAAPMRKSTIDKREQVAQATKTKFKPLEKPYHVLLNLAADSHKCTHVDKEQIRQAVEEIALTMKVLAEQAELFNRVEQEVEEQRNLDRDRRSGDIDSF